MQGTLAVQEGKRYLCKRNDQKNRLKFLEMQSGAVCQRDWTRLAQACAIVQDRFDRGTLFWSNLEHVGCVPVCGWLTQGKKKRQYLRGGGGAAAVEAAGASARVPCGLAGVMVYGKASA